MSFGSSLKAGTETPAQHARRHSFSPFSFVEYPAMAADLIICGSCNERPTRLLNLPCGNCRRTAKNSCPLARHEESADDDSCNTNDSFSIDGHRHPYCRWLCALLAVVATTALLACFWGQLMTPLAVMAGVSQIPLIIKAILHFSRNGDDDDELEGDTMKDEEDCLSCESCRRYDHGRNGGLLPRRHGVKSVSSNPPSYIFCQDAVADDDVSTTPMHQGLTCTCPVPVPMHNVQMVTADMAQSKLSKKYDLATWNMYNRIIRAREARRAMCEFFMGSMEEEDETATLIIGRSKEAKEREEGLLLAICPSALYSPATATPKVDDDNFIVSEETSMLRVHQECFYGATGVQACVQGQSAEEGMVFPMDL